MTNKDAMTTKAANAEMIAFWNEMGGSRWVRDQVLLDEQLDPIGRLAFAAADVKPGEAVIDVGCGCGSTSLELGQLVGAEGRVVGLDISETMLELASRRARAAGLDHVSFAAADAQIFAFEGDFDLLFSRFGVMFFEDPFAAFLNLHGALKPGGRVAFVCWQALPLNPWMAVPIMAALKHITIEGPSAPHAPGPFGLADAERTESILASANFHDIKVTAHDVEMSVGGDVELDEAVRFILELSPLSRALVSATPELRETVAGAVRESLLPYRGPRGVRMAGAVWVVTARA